MFACLSDMSAIFQYVILREWYFGGWIGVMYIRSSLVEVATVLSSGSLDILHHLVAAAADGIYPGTLSYLVLACLFVTPLI